MQKVNWLLEIMSVTFSLDAAIYRSDIGGQFAQSNIPLMKHLTLTLVGFLFVLSSYSNAQTPAPASVALCFACHGPDGKGIGAGTPTPMAPPFVGSKFVNDGDGEIMASIVFTGIAKEDAKFLGMMAPLGAVLNDDQLAEVLTYVRGNFTNKSSAVTAAQVKTWREKYNGKPMQKRTDIEKLLKPAAAQ
jgi:mono/diheme cytochrome c family protein